MDDKIKIFVVKPKDLINADADMMELAWTRFTKFGELLNEGWYIMSSVNDGAGHIVYVLSND